MLLQCSVYLKTFNTSYAIDPFVFGFSFSISVLSLAYVTFDCWGNWERILNILGVSRLARAQTAIYEMQYAYEAARVDLTDSESRIKLQEAIERADELAAPLSNTEFSTAIQVVRQALQGAEQQSNEQSPPDANCYNLGSNAEDAVGPVDSSELPGTPGCPLSPASSDLYTAWLPRP